MKTPHLELSLNHNYCSHLLRSEEWLATESDRPDAQDLERKYATHLVPKHSTGSNDTYYGASSQNLVS